MSGADEKIRAVKFDGHALAGCADRAGVIVIVGTESGQQFSRHKFMVAADWDRFADEVLAALAILAAAQGQPEKESLR